MPAFDSSPVIVDDLFPHTELLAIVLGISPNGIMLLSAMFDPNYRPKLRRGKLIDYGIHYANPVAQRMFGLSSSRPSISYLQQFPDSIDNGVFDFLNKVRATGKPGRYKANSYDKYSRLACRRVGAGLLLSVTDTIPPTNLMQR